MIPVSTDFDLGRDTTRIKDRRDAERQHRTVEVLLERMFHSEPERRWELQLVADEVGMGKTFVALAVAYSVLAAMHSGQADGDLRGCARRVLVISPQNAALTKKWHREVQEFVRRCIPEELARDCQEWFAPEQVDRMDELAMKLRQSDGAGVIVTNMGVLGGRKLRDYNLKRRFLLGVLFRFWGNGFQKDARARLLKGAPEGWPTRADELTSLHEDEWAVLPFAGEGELLEALTAMRSNDPEGAAYLERLRELCRDIAAPYARNRGEQFSAVESMLNWTYRRACFASVAKALPLVIVDEAHNWKNGPRQKANGYAGFEQLLAPLTRRALLLTATPFQLRPQEMLEILRVGSVIAPCGSRKDSRTRTERLDQHRENVIRPVLENAERQSRVFAKAWARLPTAATRELERAWFSPALGDARRELARIANLQGVVEEPVLERIVEGAVIGTDPDIRDILREALRLYTYNQDLSQELGVLVIRHRRRTDHRLVRIGSEFDAQTELVHKRPDRHLLHAAPGLDVRGEGELPHYLLMRCVSEMKQGKGRSSLGSALTGCYSTLLESAEGKTVRSKLVHGGDGSVYLDLLLGMVGAAQDPEHPKVRAVVRSVVEAWRSGEKSLLFCFRVHTARRLKEILDGLIRDELRARRDSVLGGEQSLTRLRSRFTRREGDLIVLGLDRVFWSLRWASRSNDVPLPELSADSLRLQDGELPEFARLALRYDVDLEADQVDRVFIHRAVEHIIARRIRASRLPGGPLFSRVLADMAEERWVRFAYGLDAEHEVPDSDAEGDGEGEVVGLDERGVHTVFAVKRESPPEEEVRRLADELRDRRERARRQRQTPVFDSYASAPSFWLGKDVEAMLDADGSERATRSLAALHAHLVALTRGAGGLLDWKERRMVFQALRRALMRESLLLRLLPERSELDERSWGELLVERFFAPLPGQHESVADRLAVFVEDLQASAGPSHKEGSTRHGMYEATRLRDAGFVVLVDGSTNNDRRERVFAGFNSPLLPEVLICTTVGQEGIDLHRHCRNVVHYDLAWNPAVLEQRTGRVDRIGSKTFREREVEGRSNGHGPFLEVGVPFLAGTYDERMYEELRIRAQTFEVLTGGDVSADNLEGLDDQEQAEGTEGGLTFPTLPQHMVADLRVRLHVWEDEASR